MSKFGCGDEVVFRQLANSVETADEVDEDHKAWNHHRGDVIRTFRDEDGNQMVKVEWDDGKTTETQSSKLHEPDEVDWYEE